MSWKEVRLSPVLFPTTLKGSLGISECLHDKLRDFCISCTVDDVDSCDIWISVTIKGVRLGGKQGFWHYQSHVLILRIFNWNMLLWLRKILVYHVSQ